MGQSLVAWWPSLCCCTSPRPWAWPASPGASRLLHEPDLALQPARSWRIQKPEGAVLEGRRWDGGVGQGILMHVGRVLRGACMGGGRKGDGSHAQHASPWSQGISDCGDRGIDPLKSCSFGTAAAAPSWWVISSARAGRMSFTASDQAQSRPVSGSPSVAQACKCKARVTPGRPSCRGLKRELLQCTCSMSGCVGQFRADFTQRLHGW